MPKVPDGVRMAGAGRRKRLTAVGITCGIGSMLVGARQAGFDVVGNIEWRKYYHAKDSEGRNTFLENFPGALMVNSIEDLDSIQLGRMTGCDIALGHPECGNFSNLGGSCKNRLEMAKDPCDIPLFINLVARLKPRFFVMDDLPKSLGAFTMAEYAEKLPDYDLYPEWISNHGYGNVQRGRKRMFMIGSLRSERWAFVPGEVPHDLTLRDILEGVEECENHVPHAKDSVCDRATSLGNPKRWTWREVAEIFMSSPPGTSFPYLNANKEWKSRVGFLRTHWEKGCHVLTGGNPICHPLTGYPLSIRERARVQGFPDDFVFYSEKVNDRGEWDHLKNLHLIKQTGKAMPVQFCRYASEQIMGHIRGISIPTSGERLLRSDSNIDSAKRWYCENVGYSDQEKACRNCWMEDSCSIRVEKYGIGEPPTSPANGRIPLPRVDRSKVVGPRIAKTRTPKPVKSVEVLEKFPSRIKGRKPGIGLRMRELIDLGTPDMQIVKIVRAEFPGSSANLTDVAKVKSGRKKR